MGNEIKNQTSIDNELLNDLIESVKNIIEYLPPGDDDTSEIIGRTRYILKLIERDKNKQTKVALNKVPELPKFDTVNDIFTWRKLQVKEVI